MRDLLKCNVMYCLRDYGKKESWPLSITTQLTCVCVRVCVCVRACVRACVRVCVVRVCVYVCVGTYVRTYVPPGPGFSKNLEAFSCILENILLNRP